MIDVIIPFYRKELEDCKKLVDLLSKINDPACNLILLATQSCPAITQEEIDYVNSSRYAKTTHIMSDEELKSHAAEIGLVPNRLEHYYHLTTTIFDWIIKKSNFKKNECFIWLECDMIPIHSKWCTLLYEEWIEKNKPFILGNWWHGAPMSGLAPTMLGIYSWEFKSADYRWGHWGPFDREILYICYKNKFRFVPTTRICKIKQLYFIFDKDTNAPVEEVLKSSYNQHVCIIDDKQYKDYIIEVVNG